MTEKSSFALFIGNRGFFPASLLESARKEMTEILEARGHKVLALDASETRHGAVETPEEGRKYAKFLAANRNKVDGVVLTLPNFGDETGAVEALKDAGVPILVVAYPDELDKMAPEKRRDAFCGKFSVMDVFCQYGVNFTALQPHTVDPKSEAFEKNIDHFDRLCRVVSGMRDVRVGAIGARTTAFKTVRIDELALQKNGITMETFDLSELFGRMKGLNDGDDRVKAKRETLVNYTSWKGVPDKALENLVKMGVALDDIIDEAGLDAVAVRCWIEMQQQLGVSPCVLLSEMNNRKMITACEVDVGNAVMMRALNLASGDVATCLDWNNNYGDDLNKCILFHCGPVPQSMMTGKGQVEDHAILANAVGKGCSYGCNVGRIAPTDFTFGSMLTDSGRLKFYLGSGRFTDDSIPDDFFGCGGVAEIPNLQDVLQTIGLAGHRHHVSVTPAHVLEPVRDAFQNYLDYDLTLV